MKIKRILLVILLLLLVAISFACNGNKEYLPSADTPSENTEPKEPTIIEGSKTLLIYMCGSNLETKQGLAGKNIDELLSASVDDKLNIVIQTGGAKTWRKHGISSTQSQRYEIKDGELVLLSSFENKNMGDPSTLTDFLVWGQENYLSEKNILLFWDHGGGATKGVCFDENYGFDSLTLAELKTAFADADLYAKFDIIGFDACLMSNIETTDYVKDYARYMVASEEIVPSGGWDYKAIAESFSVKDDPLDVGKDICDSFMEKCKKSKKADISTLSLIDLSKMDLIFERFNSLGKDLSIFVGKENAFSKVIASAKRCEKFGYDSVFSGSSNMIDFLDFTKLLALSDFNEYVKAIEIVETAVVYSVTGEERGNGGLSFFYPIDYNEKEIIEYISLGISQEYNEFLSTYYLRAPEKAISFFDNGFATDDGAFGMTLTSESAKYLSTVTYRLIEKDEDGTEKVLYSDIDIQSDWDNLTFISNFNGTRKLYNGHAICYSTVRVDKNRIEYCAPISINGRKGNMHFYYYPQNEREMRYYAPRNFSSMLKNWLPNEFYNPWEGDFVRVAECLIKSDDGFVSEYGEEFEIKELDYDELYGEITEVPLSGSTYYYVFVVTDIFGNEYYSDMATFKMKYTYEYLIENPLPEGTFAANVTDIETYND